MKATLRLKLHADDETTALLLETVRQSTECFNAVCRYGWESNDNNGINLHHATYTSLRRIHPELPSQLVVSARSKAVEALKSVEKRIHQGRKASCPQSELCPIRYDARSYWVKLSEGKASLATICGRVEVDFNLPECYGSFLCWQTCSADLCYNSDKNRFYLHVVVKEESPVVEPTGTVVGCDLGIKRIAVTSTPKFFSSKRLRNRVRQHQKLKSDLQAKGTKSAKRHLKKSARRWTRFMACENHRIANAILAPLNPGDTLSLEDLKGIRDRCVHGKKQRGPFHRWSFAQLAEFLAYKAERKGVLVVFVDPRYSSQTCSKCGYCHKSNRKSQSRFCCTKCGYTVNADFNAASNLRQRGISSLVRLLSDSQSQPTATASSLAQALRKATYGDSSVETQRAASPQRLRGGI